MLLKCKLKADQANFQSIDLRMWENFRQEHQKATASLLTADKKTTRGEGVEGLKEVAACLGISIRAISSSSVKTEIQSEGDGEEEGEVEDGWEAKDEMVKEEAMEKRDIGAKK